MRRRGRQRWPGSCSARQVPRLRGSRLFLGEVVLCRRRRRWQHVAPTATPPMIPNNNKIIVAPLPFNLFKKDGQYYIVTSSPPLGSCSQLGGLLGS